MSTMTQLITAEDLLTMPDDGSRYELVKGELRKMPPAGNIHGNRTMRLGWRLAQYVEMNDLGIVFAAGRFRPASCIWGRAVEAKMNLIQGRNALPHCQRRECASWI